MYIHGDIFFSPSYPMYFGIGNKRFEDRVKAAGQDWLRALNDLKKAAVISISIENNQIYKDENGNVDLPVVLKKDFEENNKAISNEINRIDNRHKKLIVALNDMLSFEYIEDVFTLHITHKHIKDE